MRNIYDYIKDPILIKELREYEHLDSAGERDAFSKRMQEYIAGLPEEQQSSHNKRLVEDIENVLKMVDADIEDIKRERNKKDIGLGRKIASITL